jgi:hypothetical protein
MTRKMASDNDRPDFDPSDDEDWISRLYPVRKARVASPGHVYFIPVSSFPVPSGECGRLNQFLDALCGQYAESVEGPSFCYLAVLNSVLKDEALRLLVSKMFDWRPMQALAMFPSQAPPHLLTARERRDLEEDFSLEKLHQAAPMMTRISRKGAVKGAYADLLGTGGSAFYLSALDEQRFFRMTREVFGYRITEPIYQALKCLPFFYLDALLEATERQFQALQTVADLYIGESLEDGGVIITSSICLDRILARLAYLIDDEVW